MSRFWIIAILLGTFFVSGLSSTAYAQLTPENRKQLNELSKEATRAGTLIKKKELDEAQKVLAEVELKLQEISASAMVPATDPAIRRVATLLGKQQVALEKAAGKTKPDGPEDAVSFMKDVAPLIVGRCVQCHGEDNPRNGLRLDRFIGWRTGGKSGPLLTPGNALRSLITLRVNAPEGKGRMPANGAALTAEEKEVLTSWINQGAKFDGASEETSLANLIYEEEAKNVKIPKPKGGEQVSFTRDIAPWFSNLCLNCHNSRRRSGGLSVETFFDIMKGGESGEVVIPGDMKNSRLFLLVGGKELPRMPQGQARITRKNYEDLVKWFEEGNTYDGADPRTLISTFVPSDAEMAQQNLGALSDADLQKLRQERTDEQYRKAISGDGKATLTTDNFLLVGNVDEPRLTQIQGWADEHLQTLQKAFENTQKPWRGRLSIFVMKDPFSYNEFLEVIERRRPDPDLTGHSKVTVGQEDAYIVLQDQPGNDSAMQASVIDHLTGAYMQKSGKALPVWVVRGAGLAMADAAIPDRQRSDALEKTAAQLLPSLTRPEQVFADGTFSPSGSAAVGYTLVKFLLSSGGPKKFSQFIKAIEGGATAEAALQSTYGAPPATIANGYLSKVKSR
ncbi:c-type cytochrome domain-containing protein [Planctomicrobium sp. SH661]|uniref:c-type cytochrome domain-containing protein n=1 Tax=Planctomicrobium sp. SH661 TaxID=3448124 RepID=UPI003F5B2F59